MRLNILALLGIIIGVFLVLQGIDQLVPWRGWFLSLSGLFLFLAGVLRIGYRLRRSGKGEIG